MNNWITFYKEQVFKGLFKGKALAINLMGGLGCTAIFGAVSGPLTEEWIPYYVYLFKNDLITFVVSFLLGFIYMNFLVRNKVTGSELIKMIPLLLIALGIMFINEVR